MARETIGQAWVAVTPDTEHFGREAKEGVGSALGGLAKAAAGMFAAVGVTKFVGSIISAAGDMGETISKTTAIFGAQSEGLQKWAEGAATSMGQSKQQALDAASTFAVFGKGAGLAGDDLAGFATGLTGVASDMASFHNASPEEAIQAIGAGLRGEAEPLRRFGILLDDATLRAKAMEMGLTKTTKDALTPQQKVLASQAVIMGQLGDAQGDFARTSGGLANQQRILSAEFANAKTQLGERLLPIATTVVSFFARNMGPALETVGKGFDAVGEAVSYFIGGLTGEATNEGSGILLFLNQLGMRVREVVDFMVAAWPTVRDAIVDVFNSVRDVVLQVWPEVQAAIGEGFALIQQGFQWLLDNQEVLIGAAVAIGAILLYLFTTWAASAAAAAVATIAAAAPVYLLVGAIVALGGAVAYAYENWEGFRNVVDSVARFMRDTVWPILKSVFEWLRDNVPPILQAIVDAIVNYVIPAAKAMAEFFVNEVLPKIQTVVRWIVDTLIPTLVKIATTIFNVAVDVGTAVADIVGFIIGLPGRIASTIDGLWEGLKTGITTAKDWVGDRIDDVVEFATGLPGRMVGIFDGMWDGIKNAFKSAINAVIRGWNAIEFKIPGFKVGPIGYDGFTLGVPDIPTMHSGGVFRAPGGEGLALLRDQERVLSVDERARYETGTGSVPLISIGTFVANDRLDVEELGRTLGFALAAEGVVA